MKTYLSIILTLLFLGNSIGQNSKFELKGTVSALDGGTKFTSPFGLDSIMPSISLIDTNGHQISFNKGLLEKYTLVDFWFHNCGYCIKEFPSLKEIYAKWQPNGFEIIGISTDSKAMEADWKSAIIKYNLSWSQYLDIRGAEAQKLSIYSFPTNFLLDETGKVIAKNISPAELDLFLKEHLSNPNIYDNIEPDMPK